MPFLFCMKKKILIGLTILCVACLAACGLVESSEGIQDTIDEQVAKFTIGEAKEVTSISAGKYTYDLLPQEEQVVYDQILDAILGHDSDVVLSTKSIDDVDRIYNDVLSDYGGLFWVCGYSYQTYYRKDRVIGITFSPTYSMDRATRDSYQAEIDAVVEQWLSEVPAGADDYEKSKFVYEKLISTVDYDVDSPNNQNIISVFLGNATVCQGYADAVCYLLDEMGVQAAVVTGVANNESHAWNLVRLDGDYYYLDTTWGNSRYLDADASTEGNMINYAYLNVTAEEIAQTHRAKVQYELPECVATQDNYYNREGLYFAIWDPDAIGAVFADAYYGGDEMISVKFAGNDLYSQALEYFLTQGRFIDYCRDLRSLAYIESQEMSVLTFMF